MMTAAEVDALLEQLKSRGASKAEIVKVLSADCLGWPYVFGAWGAMCTPENRRAYAARCRAKHAAYAEKIAQACPVLNGKQWTCDGCKWQGTRCFDCRGFTHWLLEQAGLQLYGDTVTSQWEQKSNWAVQGDIADMPENLVCCIFRKGHTGMYLGGGITRHCSTIVKEEPMPGNPKWLRWGIPAGLYTTDELRKAGLNVEDNKNIPTIRKGATGDRVRYLQGLLINEGYDAYLDGERPVDGIFGSKTEKAVKAFQRDNGLTVDGICGPKTWAALGVTQDEQPEEPETPEAPEAPEAPMEEPEAHPPDDETVAVPKAMLEYIAGALEDLASGIRGYAGN